MIQLANDWERGGISHTMSFDKISFASYLLSALVVTITKFVVLGGEDKKISQMSVNVILWKDPSL